MKPTVGLNIQNSVTYVRWCENVVYLGNGAFSTEAPWKKGVLEWFKILSSDSGKSPMNRGERFKICPFIDSQNIRDSFSGDHE